MRGIFILVPSLSPTGPVKGAVALANALVRQRRVTLVALKKGPGVDAQVHPNVRQVCLAERRTTGVVRAYRRLLRDAGGRVATASISVCLSADITNLFCGDLAVTCSSVRGNLVGIYRVNYGAAGRLLAACHLTALRRLDCVVAMNASMAREVARFTGAFPRRIGNFVDETALEPYRDPAPREGPLRFVFLGSLTPRKQPKVAIDAFARIVTAGTSARLDVAGDGPLKRSLEEQIRRRGLSEAVTLHGHLQNPYALIAGADALVLPSLKEGTPRAALEALYLGVPCVLRDVDGNAELVQHGVNGALFRRDEDLADALLAAGRLGRAGAARVSLLPGICRQQDAAGQYLHLVESV